MIVNHFLEILEKWFICLPRTSILLTCVSFNNKNNLIGLSIDINKIMFVARTDLRVLLETPSSTKSLIT